MSWPAEGYRVKSHPQLNILVLSKYEAGIQKMDKNRCHHLKVGSQGGLRPLNLKT